MFQSQKKKRKVESQDIFRLGTNTVSTSSSQRSKNHRLLRTDKRVEIEAGPAPILYSNNRNSLSLRFGIFGYRYSAGPDQEYNGSGSTTEPLPLPISAPRADVSMSLLETEHTALAALAGQYKCLLQVMEQMMAGF